MEYMCMVFLSLWRIYTQGDILTGGQSVPVQMNPWIRHWVFTIYMVYYLAPEGGARYCINPACLSVCVSVCPANENLNV